MIYSYSPRGFNIDGNKVLGPCALLPPAILQWNVRSISKLVLIYDEVKQLGLLLFIKYLSLSLKVGTHKDITEESVSLFHMLEPRIGKYMCS